MKQLLKRMALRLIQMRCHDDQPDNLMLINTHLPEPGSEAFVDSQMLPVRSGTRV